MEFEYTHFKNINEKLLFMKKYGLAPKQASMIPVLWHKLSYTLYQKCDLLGYTEENDTFSVMVIDYGNGPVKIHSDYLLDMQNHERHKGTSLKKYVDTYVIFDFETTGINIKTCEIIQIGAIKVKNGVQIDAFNEFVRPENPIPDKISSLTGITELDVCNADSIEIVLKKFIDFIGDNILVGFNISSFDTTLLYDFALHFYNIEIKNNFIDLRYIAESYFKKNKIEMSNLKLTTIADYFGFDTQNAHQALEDCHIAYKCYLKLFDLDNTSPVQEVRNETSNDFEEKVLKILSEIIKKEELPENSLYIASNIYKKEEKKGQINSKSICVHEPDYPLNSKNVDRIGKNDTFALISYEKKGEIKLKIRDRFINEIVLPDNVKTKKTKSDGLFSNVIFKEDDPSIYDFITQIVMLGLKHYESNSSFGCCSQFIRCSDEKKCVHENKLYSKGCKYRQNLESGKIFYGKNCNINNTD